jgi:hypothetical protein
MSNLAVTDILEFAVFGLAVVQALMIILTLRRERDVEELRELVDQQRLRLVELTAWLAGRNSFPPRRIRSEREPVADAKMGEPEPGPKDSPETVQPRITADEAARAAKTLSWQREIAARLQAGLKEGASPTDPTKPREDLPHEDLPHNEQPAPAEDALKRATKPFNWFRRDPDEPREIVEARKVVAGLKGNPLQAGPATAPEDPVAVSPNTVQDELERATRAIDWLVEDADKAREIARLTGASPGKRDA